MATLDPNLILTSSDVRGMTEADIIQYYMSVGLSRAEATHQYNMRHRPIYQGGRRITSDRGPEFNWGFLNPLVEGLVGGLFPKPEPAGQTIILQTAESKVPDVMGWLPWIAVGGAGLFLITRNPPRRRRRRRRKGRKG